MCQIPVLCTCLTLFAESKIVIQQCGETFQILVQVERSNFSCVQDAQPIPTRKRRTADLIARHDPIMSGDSYYLCNVVGLVFRHLVVYFARLLQPPPFRLLLSSLCIMHVKHFCV